MCETGFPECLHSPILRGLKVFTFVVTEPSRAGAQPHQYDFVRRYAFKPRAGLSNQNPSAEDFSGLIERSAMKKLPLMLALASLFVPQSVVRAQFANAVISYDHGTGFAAPRFSDVIRAAYNRAAPRAGAYADAYAVRALVCIKLQIQPKVFALCLGDLIETGPASGLTVYTELPSAPPPPGEEYVEIGRNRIGLLKLTSSVNGGQ